MKDKDFVKGFYCCKCGSTTAIIVGNLKVVRCMGCLTVYEEGDKWRISDKYFVWHPPVDIKNNLQPPPAKPNMAKRTS